MAEQELIPGELYKLTSIGFNGKGKISRLYIHDNDFRMESVTDIPLKCTVFGIYVGKRPADCPEWKHFLFPSISSAYMYAFLEDFIIEPHV